MNQSKVVVLAAALAAMENVAGGGDPSSPVTCHVSATCRTGDDPIFESTFFFDFSGWADSSGACLPAANPKMLPRCRQACQGLELLSCAGRAPEVLIHPEARDGGKLCAP